MYNNFIIRSSLITSLIRAETFCFWDDIHHGISLYIWGNIVIINCVMITGVIKLNQLRACVCIRILVVKLLLIKGLILG